MATKDDMALLEKTWSSSKYKPEFCEQLRKHLGKGLSMGSFNVPGGVSYNTLMNWVKRYPSFAQAREMGEKSRLELLEVEGIKMVKAGNVVAWKFMMSQHGMVDAPKEVNINHTVSPLIAGVPDTIRYARQQRLKELHQKVMAGGVAGIIEGEVDEEDDLGEF
jgi:hypothetical protein